MGYQSIEEIQSANRDAGQFWFTPGTMAFFRTRIESEVIAGYWFITSEEGPIGERRFSIRVADDQGMVDTVGQFMGYDSAQAAREALDRHFAEAQRELKLDVLMDRQADADRSEER